MGERPLYRRSKESCLNLGDFLGRISMGRYPNKIWRLIRRLPTGEQPVIIGVVMELESIGDSSLVEVELFMEVDSN